MIRLIRLVVLLSVVTVLGLFLIANSQTIDWSFWPLPFGIAVPAYVVPLAALLLGLVLGSLIVWLKMAFKREKTP